MDVSSSESFVFTLPTSARVVNGVKIADLSGGGGGTGAGAVAIAFEVSSFTAAVDTHYEVNATGGNVIATIPAADADNAGKSITIARVDGTGNSLTVASVSTINGDATVDIVFQNSALTIRSTGAMWRII